MGGKRERRKIERPGETGRKEEEERRREMEMRKEWEQQQDKWQEESQERLVKRVEEIVIRYIRGRFMEMEQRVEEKKNSKK